MSRWHPGWEDDEEQDLEPQRPPAEPQVWIDTLLEDPELAAFPEASPAYEQLTRWYEEHESEHDCLGEAISQTPPGHFNASRPEFLCDWRSDEEVIEAAGLPSRTEITDQQRLEYLDKQAKRYFEEEIDMDSDAVPACAVLPIQSSDGREAVLGFGIRGGPGTITTWYGIFSSLRQFRGWMRNEGYLTCYADYKALGRSILRHWGAEL